MHILDVFLLVLLSDFDISASRLQVDCYDVAELIVVGGEGEIEDVGDVVVAKNEHNCEHAAIKLYVINLQNPLQTPVEFCVDTFHIGNGDLLVQDHLVEGDDEEGVQEAAVEDSQTDHATDEAEVVEMLGVDGRVGVDLEGVVVVGRVFKQA